MDDDNYYSFDTPDIDTSSSYSSSRKSSRSSSSRSSSNHKKQAKKADEVVSVGQIAHTLLSNFFHNLDHYLEERSKRIDPNKKIVINGKLTQQIDQDTYKLISPDSEGKILYINSQGDYHRNDGPAIIHTDGKVEYYYHGKLHRENNEPAVIFPNGSNIYYSWGIKTRWNGPAETIINEDGSSIQKYYIENQLSRRSGPAVIHSNGEYLYYESGKLHNENGPASHLLVKGTTDKFEDEYWIHGKQLSSLQFKMLKLRNKVFKNTINDMKYN